MAEDNKKESSASETEEYVFVDPAESIETMLNEDRNRYVDDLRVILMKSGMLKGQADKLASIIRYKCFDKTLQKYITQRCNDRNESQDTKDLRRKLQRQA